MRGSVAKSGDAGNGNHFGGAACEVVRFDCDFPLGSDRIRSQCIALNLKS